MVRVTYDTYDWRFSFSCCFCKVSSASILSNGTKSTALWYEKTITFSISNILRTFDTSWFDFDKRWSWLWFIKFNTANTIFVFFFFFNGKLYSKVIQVIRFAFSCINLKKNETTFLKNSNLGPYFFRTKIFNASKFTFGHYQYFILHNQVYPLWPGYVLALG